MITNPKDFSAYIHSTFPTFSSTFSCCIRTGAIT